MLKVGIIVGSTRPGRKSEAVARWVREIAVGRGDADYELVDIESFGLPLLDEPVPPSMGQYSKEHTKRWAEKIASLDAFVFVTPEYNFATPPSLVNALDHLLGEWQYKAAGFVSYGGVSGGLRATQMTRMLLTSFKIVPMVEQVIIPFVANELKDGRFPGNEKTDKSAQVMLDELLKWTNALRGLR